MIFHFFSNALEIVVDVSGHDLRVALRLGDIGVTKHLADVLDGNTMPEHICGERVTRHVTTQRSLDSTGRTKCFQQHIIFVVADLRHLPVVSLQNFHHRWQQLRGVRYARLDALTYILPHTINLLVFSDVKVLSICIGKTSITRRGRAPWPPWSLQPGATTQKPLSPLQSGSRYVPCRHV